MKTFFTFTQRSLYRLIILSAFLFTFFVSAFSQTKHTIEASDNLFTPHFIEIMIGDTVEWINNEGLHNVNGQKTTFDSNPESFGNSTGTGWIYSHVFNAPGTYYYQCDVHAGLGMNGVIVVTPSDEDVLNIVVNFSGMNPHAGQKLWLSVVDKETGNEVDRESVIVSQEFSVSTAGIESGHSYYVDFYADFNDNGRYDAPPIDHAWRLEIDNVPGDTTVNFSHNTEFFDIKWQNKLTVYFLDMDPHIDQHFNLAVIEKSTGTEVGRVAVIADMEFSINTHGIEKDKSYFVNFYADYNENSAYDVPPEDHAWSISLNNVTSDTTLIFSHNAGMIADIKWQNRLTVNFSGMNPHIGQDLWLTVTDKMSGEKIGNVNATVEEEFDLMVYGIKNERSYYVDFYADHNQNGSYDAPPTDHAWRLDLDNVLGDAVLNFSHNTNFTDIEKEKWLIVNFTGMNPHMGQEIKLSVTDKNTGEEIERLKTTAATSFSISVYGLEEGSSYNIDFFADHNGNGSYDTPPIDHAWRIELDDVTGDTTLNFAHNTDFTDIKWQNKLTINFTGMNPHVGQDFWLSVTEKDSGIEMERIKITVDVDFSVNLFGTENGKSYNIDFFADHNQNGNYDAPPTDHAWRLGLNDVSGDATLNFAHNTNFTDIMWQNKLTINFSEMIPHVGQTLWLSVIDKNSDTETDRVKTIIDTAFTIYVYGIENGKSYNIDFFADHNKNGSYDAPPTDHAWRLELNETNGDTTLNFVHNTNFTDIRWQNKLTVNFIAMAPHVGQDLWLAVIDQNSGLKADSIETGISEDFTVHLYGIESGKSYNIDFFADHNQNGSYDKPPVDHAWRLMLNDVAGDTTLNFVHNTSFTDIFNTTSIKENNFRRLSVHPNPVVDKVTIQFEKIGSDLILSLKDITGKTNPVNWIRSNHTVEVDLTGIKSGIYFLEIRTNGQRKMLKLIKE